MIPKYKPQWKVGQHTKQKAQGSENLSRQCFESNKIMRGIFLFLLIKQEFSCFQHLSGVIFQLWYKTTAKPKQQQQQLI